MSAEQEHPSVGEDAPVPARPLFARATFAVRGFSCTTDALAASQACRAAGIPCRLVPRPESLGNAECGTALRTAPADEPRVAAALEAVRVVPSACIEVEDYV